MSYPSAEKPSGAVADFGLNWGPWLATNGNDKILQSTWGTLPAALTQPYPQGVVNQRVTFIWLAGGVDGNCYTLTNTIVTTGGRTWVGKLQILIRD